MKERNSNCDYMATVAKGSNQLFGALFVCIIQSDSFASVSWQMRISQQVISVQLWNMRQKRRETLRKKGKRSWYCRNSHWRLATCHAPHCPACIAARFPVFVLSSGTSCGPLLQTCSVAFSSAGAVVANISSTLSTMDLSLMQQAIYSYMYVQNWMDGLWDIHIFQGILGNESLCTRID